MFSSGSFTLDPKNHLEFDNNILFTKRFKILNVCIDSDSLKGSHAETASIGSKQRCYIMIYLLDIITL